MEKTMVPTHVYAESTPNPATMKFVANQLLIENGATVEYTDAAATANAPLAARLFSFPFVTGVFIASNFVTITKVESVDWYDVTLELREYITNFLQAGNEVFLKAPEHTQHAASDAAEETFIPLDAQPANSQEEQIINILEEYVRPAVEGDGGAIHFKSFDNGILTVTLRGACSGCPSSMVTLKSGIEGLFQRMMPEVQEVVAEEL
ncbi:MAG: NifU family protein [Bacteroidota bacterium]